MVIAVWVVAGLLVMAGGLVFAELGTMMPRSGGPYVFLREGYGPLVGFLYGWQGFAIGTAGLTVAGAAFAIFLNVISGDLFSGELVSIPVSNWNLTISWTQVVAVTSIFVVMLVNCTPIRLAASVTVRAIGPAVS